MNTMSGTIDPPKMKVTRIKWDPQIEENYSFGGRGSIVTNCQEALCGYGGVKEIIEESLNVYSIYYDSGVIIRVINPIEVQITKQD